MVASQSMVVSQSLFTKNSLSDFVNLGSRQKCLLINTFWPHLKIREEDYVPGNYATLFRFIGKSLQDLHLHENKFVIHDFDSLLEIIATIVGSPTSSRSELVQKASASYLNYNDTDIARSIELGLRLWLGINVSSKDLSVGRINPRDTRIDWQDGQSLEQKIKDHFHLKTAKAPSANQQLDGSFTAVNLKSICRLHIRWTDNIVDHLKLEGQRGERGLSIYRHKICLANHLEGPGLVIPKDILEEAIRSLDLLFPFGDPKTEKFLRSENIQLHVVEKTLLLRATELDDFKYWRNSLEQLLNLLNGSPETIVQTLLDTRNLPQFATVWVAIFGVFCLTILFGILSTVYAIKQYQVAVKSYDLSLAVACAQMPASLPKFCQ